MEKTDFSIVGAGLAGCECASILSSFGFTVTLFEQKPEHHSKAHVSDWLSELVCSNSLRSDEETSGVGLLKAEMRQLHSPFMQAADACRVPAGKALAVDRDEFSRIITERIKSDEHIKLVTRQIAAVEDENLINSAERGIIIAAGPLASDDFSASLASITGQKHCYFYDAIAPIIWTDTVDTNIVFRASRYGQGEESEGDYLNCPMNRDEYEVFYTALINGETFKAHEFEKEKHFGGCMPIEALAAGGSRGLTFGPLKPVGLIDPRTGSRPYAVLQLRAEKVNGETCNLVGCQTKLLQKEQQRIFRLVPGLENAEFARFGSMHRNTYVNAPEVLAADLSLKNLPGVYLAGQITGVEGYVESAACGLWLGLSLAFRALGKNINQPPETTALGSLLAHLQRPAKKFQPSNVHFGLMPGFEQKIRKKERKECYASRAKGAFAGWLREYYL